MGENSNVVSDGRGRHGNHPRGSAHYRWNSGRMLSDHGYVKIRIGKEHPLADQNGYVYEHLLVWVAAGRKPPGQGETLHHENEDKTDNRLGNLELLTRPEHAAEHHQMVSDAVVCEIRERYAAGEHGTTLAAEFGIPYQRVYRFVHGESRASAGGPIQSGSLRGKKRAGRLLDGREWNEFPHG